MEYAIADMQHAILIEEIHIKSFSGKCPICQKAFKKTFDLANGKNGNVGYRCECGQYILEPWTMKEYTK